MAVVVVGGGHNTPICDEPGWRGAVAAPVLKGSATDGGSRQSIVPGVADLKGSFHGSGQPCLLGDAAFVSSPQLLLHQPASWGRSEVSEPRAGPH